jgi:ribosomal protein L16 Arg81 hydroxylase
MKTLQDVVYPIAEDEFLREYWTKKFIHISGPQKKFSHLFSWDILNSVLDQHRFEGKRLRLVKCGRQVESENFLRGLTVESSKLTSELARGATLILNACEEMYRPLRELCVELERLFHVRVFVNLYAGWRTDNGFQIHWDTQDTLILQIAGRKHWKVWAPTRKYPFRDDLVDTKILPTEDPIWEGMLEGGGVLSLPRGWWHVAYPIDEPSLHLTVTIQNLNGLDFLHWFVNQMKASEFVRMEMPITQDPMQKREWLDQVWKDLSNSWHADLVEAYIAHVDGEASSRPSMQLPQAALDDVSQALEPNTSLQLSAARPLHLDRKEDPVRFKAAGIEWQTSADLVPFLELFNDGEPHRLSELSQAADYRLNALVAALVTKGVLRTVPLAPKECL